MQRMFGYVVLIGSLLTLLTACGGGGGGSPRLSNTEIDRLRSDPRIVRLRNIFERSDTLLMPRYPFRYTLSAQGETVSDRLFVNVSCDGDRCDADGTVFTIQEIDPSTDVELIEAELGLRGKFDTVAVKSRFNVSESVPGATVIFAPTATDYLLWGEWGVAAVTVGGGPVSGRYQGVAFSGNLSVAAAYAAGDVTGTNPSGIGRATWRGIAEAASTRTFERRLGTATLTIADLSRPRISAEIDVEGYAIGSPAWADIPPYGGHFVAGAAGRDYLEGNFHGLDHSEAYGVFDTGAYIGAFGAKRD